MARAQPSLPVAARKALLDWYRPRARAYPWRRGRPNAYRTLVSELMLQQTQAPRVVPIFEAFVGVFPTVRALAGASRADVLRAWAGLGYNRRAVSLHRAAQAVVAEHGGRVPTDRADLQRLPGVGPYTAAAIASIAGGEPVAAIDVNARRIVARVAYGRDAASVSTVDIDATAATWVDRTDPGAWNQALMDLGREHCRAVPRCEGCPLAGACRFVRVGPRAGAGRPEAVPVRGIDTSGPRRGGRRATRTTVGRCRRSRAEHRVRSRSDRGGARRAGARRGGSALRALVSAPGLMKAVRSTA